MKLNAKNRRTDLICMVLLYLAVLAVHLNVALKMKMLHMSHDEMGVLATAAYAVGEDWSEIVSMFGYYGYGSSILYIPIFMFTKDALLRYRLVAVLNSFLMALIPVIAYRIAVKYCKADRRTAVFAAAVTGLYPGYLLFSKWVWNETMMCLLPWVTALLMFALYRAQSKKKRVVFSLLLSFVLVYSYAVHGRALGLIAAVFLIMAAVYFFQKRLMIEPVSFFSSFAAFLICDHFAKKFVQAKIWLIGSGSEASNTLSSTSGKMSTYLTFKGFKGLMKISLGQLSAASASTYGVIVIAAVAAVPFIVRGLGRKMRLKKGEAPGKEHALWLLMTITAVFFAGAFAISVLFLGGEGSAEAPRGDYFLYTRYFSNMLGFPLFAAFIYFAGHELKSRTAAVMAGVFVLCAWPLMKLEPAINSAHDSSNATILNLLSYLGDNPEGYMTHFDIHNLLLVTSIVFGAALMGFSGKKQGILCVLLCFVSLQAYHNTSKDVILANGKKDYSFVRVPMEVLGEVDGLEDTYDDVYYYNVHQQKPWSSSAMQFALPEYDLTEFDFEINEDTDPQVFFDFISENSIIVSSEDIHLEELSPDIYRVEYGEVGSGKEYIWVYGTEARDYITAHSSISFAQAG
jgi:hypothetical protein